MWQTSKVIITYYHKKNHYKMNVVILAALIQSQQPLVHHRATDRDKQSFTHIQICGQFKVNYYCGWTTLTRDWTSIGTVYAVYIRISLICIKVLEKHRHDFSSRRRILCCHCTIKLRYNYRESKCSKEKNQLSALQCTATETWSV